MIVFFCFIFANSISMDINEKFFKSLNDLVELQKQLKNSHIELEFQNEMQFQREEKIFKSKITGKVIAETNGKKYFMKINIDNPNEDVAKKQYFLFDGVDTYFNKEFNNSTLVVRYDYHVRYGSHDTYPRTPSFLLPLLQPFEKTKFDKIDNFTFKYPGNTPSSSPLIFHVSDEGFIERVSVINENSQTLINRDESGNVVGFQYKRNDPSKPNYSEFLLVKFIKITETLMTEADFSMSLLDLRDKQLVISVEKNKEFQRMRFNTDSQSLLADNFKKGKSSPTTSKFPWGYLALLFLFLTMVGLVIKQRANQKNHV